ncbi:ATP-binding protein [Mesoterricola silvestris]|uniref:histidine kinase n=1 Tax=Mesoterricola silvestris TaxID=2927979 RepID=A0AA48GWK1_9BACT|nr:ATP-binding protein [Mesoterricola silvestris]BDU71653.1 hypothetical protein METEAL_08270 [Mesoterricola silvestris]
MSRPLRILYLEDSREDLELVKAQLDREYLAAEVTWVDGREAYISALRDSWNFDLLLADYALPDIGGDEALELARRRAPGLPFIFVSGSLGEERAVECLRKGATDYVLKSNLNRLAPVVRRALEEARVAGVHREAQASHARVASLLRATLESTSEGILVVDLAGRISAYNRKFLALCGIPEYVMAPMDMGDVIHYLTGQLGDPGVLLEEARLLRARSDQENRGQVPVNGRILEETSRPHTVGAETVGRVLAFREPVPREPAPGLLGAIGAGRQGFTEAALAVRIVPWILAGDRLSMPEAAAEILGLAPLPADLEGLMAILHPGDAEPFREALERSRNVGFRARVRQASGAWLWTRWSVDRCPEGYRGAIQDISEEVHLQERLDRRRRLEGARDLARRLAARLPEPLGDALRAFADPRPPAPVPTPPNAFVEALLPRAREAAGPGIRIDFEPAPGLPAARLDPGALEQALDALLANAREAMGGAGVIRLATGILYPRDHRPGGSPGPMRTRVFFEVRDAGPGIPAAVARQAFEPFFTTRAGAGNAGLGLTLAREILEAHGGSVQLEGATGTGTTVRLILPA